MSSTVRRRRPDHNLSAPTDFLLPEKGKNFEEGEFGREHWTLIAFLVFVLVGTVSHFHQCLPEPKEVTQDNSQFSEVRARSLLRELSDYGPKPAGSYACEELTRNRILKEVKVIQSSADAAVNFQVATQNPTGCFDIPEFDCDGFTICYKNVSNVIARLGRKQEGKPESIAVLLNCHYDSWPISSGGSDDLISCALMLELMRLLSSHPEKLHHDVIFLFNGAEESSLQAAHGFITQHNWRHSVRAFINLEASGSGGRELLFQAGPSNQWLLNSYLEAAIHPHCSVIGQEVFQSGVYPGDTDFRVFRDYGKVPGLDLAFVQNGYWWHTEFDEEKRITNGSLQRAGENVYSTLCHLLASPYLEKPAEYDAGKIVFFDFLGLFVVVYSIQIAHAISIAIIIFTIGFTVSGPKSFRALFNYVAVLASMFTMTYVMVKLSSYFLGVLAWYSNHWVAPVIYGLPVAWVGSSTQTFLVAGLSKRNKETMAKEVELVHSCVLSVILAIFTYYDIASGFLFVLLTLPLFRHLLPETEGWVNLLIHVIFSFPGIAMFIYTSEMLLSIFIPIMGRTSGNPEPVVASFVAFSTFFIVLNLLPILIRSRSVRESSEKGFGSYIAMLIGVFMTLTVLIYIVATINGGPYKFTDRYPTTKRTQFFHTNRLFRNEDGSIKTNDTVIYAISHDNRGAEDIPFVNRENDFAPLSCVYDDPYCEIPFYFPTRHRIQLDRHIRFKYAAEILKFPKETRLTVLRTDETPEGVKYSLQFTGSGQMSVYLIGQNGWKITNCSISAGAKRDDHIFLYLTCSGADCATWNFEVTMEGPFQKTLPRLLIGAASHYLHGPVMQSASLKEILKTIATQREKDNNWAITASAWNVDLIYQYVR